MSKKIIDWSKSTYSGTDISVIASLNFSSLEEIFLTDLTSNVSGGKESDAGDFISSFKPYFFERLNNLLSSSQKKAMTELDEEIFKRLGGFVYELGTVQTISCQSHRPKAAVRSIGNAYAKGYTRGPRTIAGSMIFTVLNQHSLRDLCKEMEVVLRGGLDGLSSTVLPDQIHPIDLTFLLLNEYGSISRMALYGVEFLNNGQTLSIEDLLLEEVVQFVALDMDPLADITDTVHTGQDPGDKRPSASAIFKSNKSSYDSWLERTDMRRRF